MGRVRGGKETTAFLLSPNPLSLHFPTTETCIRFNTRELKQPRRRRQQKPHKFAYLTMKNNILHDKCSILSSYVPSAGFNLIPGQLEHIFQA